HTPIIQWRDECRVVAAAMTDIVLCICTCDRPNGLRKLLIAVEQLEFEGSLRVVVIDNHADRAGMDVCASLASQYRFPLFWHHESKPGISEARNASFRQALSAPADFVVMLDDDEYPAPNWLAALLAEQRGSDADIVCGPVEPAYEVPPPKWISDG